MVRLKPEKRFVGNSSPIEGQCDEAGGSQSKRNPTQEEKAILIARGRKVKLLKRKEKIASSVALKVFGFVKLILSFCFIQFFLEPIVLRR